MTPALVGWEESGTLPWDKRQYVEPVGEGGAAGGYDARLTLKFEAARRLAGLKHAAGHIPREQLMRCLATVRRALCEGLDALPT